MNDLQAIKTAIMKQLDERYGANLAAIDIVALAKAIGHPARTAATMCSDLCQCGLLVGDGNMMGFIQITNKGRGFVRRQEVT